MRYLVAAFYLCLLLLTGCGDSPAKPVEQRLNLNITSDPATLDPRKGGDVLSSLFHFLLFDGLTRLDDDGNAALALADRVEVSEDNTVYTFHLKKAHWSNGSPITAWDFETSWKAILNPTFPSMNAHLLYPILNAQAAKKGTCCLSEVGIDALDAHRLRITLAQPTPYFLELAAFCVFYPVHSAIDHSNPHWDQKRGETLICSGPFTLDQWKRGNAMLLKRNPHYHKADETILEEIYFSMVDSEMTALRMFEKGEIDVIGRPVTALPSDAIPELIESGLLKVYPIPATTYCTFNVDCFPFNNVNIRRAFALAINRKQIVRNITQLSEHSATHAIPTALRQALREGGYFQDADMQGARDCFKTGCEELRIDPNYFPKIHYVYAISENHRKIAQAIQQQWLETLGIQTEIKGIEKKIFLDMLSKGHFQAAQGSWIAQYNDPINIFERFQYKDNVKNYANWEHAMYAKLITQSSKAKNSTERSIYLNKAEKILMDEMPVAPIFHSNAAYISQPWVKSYGNAQTAHMFFDRTWIDVDLKKASQ